MSAQTIARPRNMLLDTGTATQIVNAERRIYANEVSGMQREKQALLNGQPWNNGVLLLANIIMAGLFFYVTSLNADAVLPSGVAWAQPLVGMVSAIGAASLMYATNAIAYKLPTITDVKTALMMWSAWIAMLIISGITSSFIALLLVNGADSKLDQARLNMAQAAQLTSAEMAVSTAAQSQLDQWIAAGVDVRAQRADAVARRDRAQAALSDWRRATLAEFGQGSAAANRRMAPGHPEHAPLIVAIETARADVAQLQGEIATLEARIEQSRAALQLAQADMRAARKAQHGGAVSEQSPWEETMADMASMFNALGLNFKDGAQFKAAFALFFALVLTLAPPFWSYQTGASVAPEVNAQAARMAEIDELGAEARASLSSGGGSLGGGGVSRAVSPSGDAYEGSGGNAHSGGEPAAQATSETASMGSMVDLALGIKDADPMLPCGLKQARFERLYKLNYDKVLKLLQDAEGKLLSRTGEIALKRRYGGNDDTAKMLKHALYLEGHGEYAADGSIALFNPAEEG